MKVFIYLYYLCNSIIEVNNSNNNENTNKQMKYKLVCEILTIELLEFKNEVYFIYLL